jgi:hypothetical protein
MTRTEEIDAAVDALEIKVLRLEPASLHDDAVIGIGERRGDYFLVYDREAVIRQTMKADGMTYEDAVEWHEFNTFCGYLGHNTPAFLNVTFT